MDADDADLGDAGDDMEDILEDLEEAEEILGDEDATQFTIAVPDPALTQLYSQHSETILDYIEEIIPKLTTKTLPPGSEDALHKSQPFLSNFEKAQIIGFRSNQLSKGARPFVVIPAHVTDVKEIARMEMEARRLPFIIKRRLPDNRYEYWRLCDLMIL